MSPMSPSITVKAVNGIFKYREQTKQSDNVTKLLHAAEQRINFVYMLIMIAIEAAILVYILLNQWDDTRFFFGGIAGAVSLTGIIINIVFRRRSYPWIKYVNNLVTIFSIFVLCGYADAIALLLILIPFINSFYFRPRFTALTGAVCLIMMYIGLMSVMMPFLDAEGNIDIDPIVLLRSSFDYSDETKLMFFGGRSFLLVAAAAFVVMSVYLSFSGRRFTIQQGELLQKNLSTAAELKVARDIQEVFLSADFSDTEAYAVYADMTSATEVGGDFYDYFLVDETHLAIVIGDVSGHGMAAAMFMTLSKTLIKVYAQSRHSAEKVFDLTNRYLQRSNPAKFFVTGWIGILDLTTGSLSYANAGHNYPVIIRKGSEPEFLSDKPNFVLGRKHLVRYMEKRTRLRPGDKLVLYTDGVTEARDPGERFFGDDRLLEVIGREKASDQKRIVTALREALTAFENGNDHYDDATILALYFKGILQVEPMESKTFFLNMESFDSVVAYVTERCAAAGCDSDTVGKIDHVTVNEFENTLNEQGEQHDSLMLDMAGVEYVSSAALRAILNAHDLMESKNGLVLRNVNNKVMEIFILFFDKRL